MRTAPAAWDSFQFRIDARHGVVVKLTDGSTTWYFGTQEMDLTGGVHVYGRIKSMSGIKHRFNPFNRTWAVGNVTVALDNSPYRKNSGGDWIRPSDDLVNLTNKTAEVYLFSGELITGMSDMMLRYRGIVGEETTHDQQTCTIRLHDETAWEDTYLPISKISDLFTDYAREVSDKLVPLVYGDYQHDGHIAGYLGGFAHSPGLTKGQYVKFTGNLQPGQFAIASHRCYSLGIPYYQESDIKEAGNFQSSIVYNTDKAWCDIQLGTIILTLLPDNQIWDGYDFSGQGKGINPELGYDLRDDTYTFVLDNVSDDGNYVVAETRFGFSETEDVAQIIATNTLPYVKIRYRVSDLTFALDSASLRFYYDANIDDVPYYLNWNLNVNVFDLAWHYVGFGQAIPAIGRPLLVAVQARSAAAADGTLNNTPIFTCYALEFELRYTKEHLGIDTDVWFSVYGREFGPWIDAGGRTGSGYNEGDLIEDPAYVIESLLRDELGFTDNDLDVTSFDDAANAYGYARISMSLHNDNSSKIGDIIRQICEQSTFVFTYTSEGKIRLIDLSQSSPSSVRTIPFSHIIGGDVFIKSANKIINRLNVESRYWQQIGEYRDKTVYNDSPSQASGIVEDSVQWPNLVTEVARNLVAEHYVKASTGLWSNPHDEISLETPGVMYGDLEVGDWIEIDGTTVDPHIKPHGNSWSGRLHMITETVQLLDRTRITAVKL